MLTKSCTSQAIKDGAVSPTFPRHSFVLSPLPVLSLSLVFPFRLWSLSLLSLVTLSGRFYSHLVSRLLVPLPLLSFIMASGTARKTTAKGDGNVLQPSLPTLPSRLIAARKNMVNTGFYLGDSAFRNNVTWARDGRANRLIVKAGGDKIQDGPRVDTSKYPSPPCEEIDPAPLCAVVKVSHRDFWLTADAGYCGPSQIWKDLAEVKASCANEQPDVMPFKDDFPTVIENLHWLQDNIATPGYPGKKGLFLPGNEAGVRFKVCHKLFEVSLQAMSSSYKV